MTRIKIRKSTAKKKSTCSFCCCGCCCCRRGSDHSPTTPLHRPSPKKNIQPNHSRCYHGCRYFLAWCWLAILTFGIGMLFPRQQDPMNLGKVSLLQSTNSTQQQQQPQVSPLLRQSPQMIVPPSQKPDESIINVKKNNELRNNPPATSKQQSPKLQQKLPQEESSLSTTITSSISKNEAHVNTHPPDSKIVTVAYVVTLWQCPDSDQIADAALVLRQSIHKVHLAEKGKNDKPSDNKHYTYKYQMHALILQQVYDICPIQQLKDLGYHTHLVAAPINLKSLQQGSQLQQRWQFSAKNQQQEAHSFLPLLAHTVLQEPILVLLDLATVIQKPLTALFDAMMYDANRRLGRQARQTLQQLELLDERVADLSSMTSINHYAIRASNVKEEGDFRPNLWIARRNPSLVQQALQVLYQTDYHYWASREAGTEGRLMINLNKGGWGNQGYRDPTLAGFLAYFLDHHLPQAGLVELDGCKFHHTGNSNNNNQCQATFSLFFTHGICPHPWKCAGEGMDNAMAMEGMDKIITSLTTVDHCLEMQQVWHNLRREVEQTLYGATHDGQIPKGRSGKYVPRTFHGHCEAEGSYLPIRMKERTGKKLSRILWR